MNEPSVESILEFAEGELSKICDMTVRPDTSLLDSAILDSLSLVEFIISVQKRFNITIKIADLKKEEFDSPRLMATYIFRHHQPNT